jgi:hypothetical protein
MEAPLESYWQEIVAIVKEANAKHGPGDEPLSRRDFNRLVSDSGFSSVKRRAEENAFWLDEEA